jgi:hypothetical protein
MFVAHWKHTYGPPPPVTGIDLVPLDTYNNKPFVSLCLNKVVLRIGKHVFFKEVLHDFIRDILLTLVFIHCIQKN